MFFSRTESESTHNVYKRFVRVLQQDAHKRPLRIRRTADAGSQGSGFLVT